MKKIRIVAIPPGEPPESVRLGWIGVEIPLAENPIEDGIECGVLGGRPSSENSGGYEVESTAAIEALSLVSPQAAL